MKTKTKEIFKIFLKYKFIEIFGLILFIVLTTLFGKFAIYLEPALAMTFNKGSYINYFFTGLVSEIIILMSLFIIGVVLYFFMSFNWELAENKYNELETKKKLELAEKKMNKPRKEKKNG